VEANAVSVLFSEPKIPQRIRQKSPRPFGVRFSALQRAENSSNVAGSAAPDARETVSVLFSEPKIPQNNDIEFVENIEIEFQCSSASRKFLKRFRAGSQRRVGMRFSALQRAENSSNRGSSSGFGNSSGFSALQRAENSSKCTAAAVTTPDFLVSVLFSEPKIPQTCNRLIKRCFETRFSALQRAENSSKR